MTKPLHLLLAAVLLSGCSTPNSARQSETGNRNPFEEFYQSALTALPPAVRSQVERSFEPSSGTPAIIGTSNLKAEVDALMQKNFAPIGISDFNGTLTVSQQQLHDFARKLGADRVLFYSEHQYDEARVRREVRRESDTVTTTTDSGTLSGRSQGSASVSARGSGGSASATGSLSGDTRADYMGRQTTTTSTSRNHYVPYSVGHYGYVAVYFRQKKRPIFGALCSELSQEQRAALQRNTGAVIQYIVSDSPAFKANLLKGDLILSVEGVAINSPTDLNDRIEGLAGKMIRVNMLRNQMPIAADVQLNAVEMALSPASPINAIETFGGK